MFIPMSTAQVVFEGTDHLQNLSFTLPVLDNFDAAVAQSLAFKEKMTRHLKAKHTVAPSDTRAIQIWNPLEEAKRFFTLTDNIAFFFWFVGICTIIAGVVGVREGNAIHVLKNADTFVCKIEASRIALRREVAMKVFATSPGL